MAQSSDRDEKKRPPGRPKGDATAILVRMPRAELERLDGWIAKQRGPVTRPEAIRRLVGLAIGTAEPRGLLGFRSKRRK